MGSTRGKHETNQSWTDYLEVCKNTAIGFSMNQIYREDGSPQEEHPYEDCSCHYKLENDFYWYAIYDGHEGSRIANYCAQSMTAHILPENLAGKQSDDDIKDILRQAFISVEKEYLELIGALLAERTSLIEDIKDFKSYDAYQRYPEIVDKIKSINNELSSGAACAVALVFKDKLYVANVGNCRVLLCQTDPNNVLKVVQLSVDHDLKNEDELLRLSQIGINMNTLKNSLHLGNQENTRCLGNYLVKGGYKEFEDLCMAIQDPVTAEPDIHGGILLDDTCKFLLLMSHGLYESIEEVTNTDQVNKHIAQWVVEQFREQSTLAGVAQAVVDKTVRLHHDWSMSNSLNPKKREDITLMLRNFSFPLRNDVKSPTVSFNSLVSSPITNSPSQHTLVNSLESLTNIIRTNSSTSSSEQTVSDTDPDQKIAGYVDFQDFYRNLEIAKAKGNLPDWLWS